MSGHFTFTTLLTQYLVLPYIQDYFIVLQQFAAKSGESQFNFSKLDWSVLYNF